MKPHKIYFTSRTSSTNFQTYLKPLGEIGSIRKNSDIEKAYLLGKYSDALAYTDFNIEELHDILKN